jgi:Zinc knuckle
MPELDDEESGRTTVGNEPVGRPGVDTPADEEEDYEAMTGEQLEEILAAQEAEADRQRKIQRIQYLKSGRIGTDAQMMAELKAPVPVVPYDSRGDHKRLASRDAEYDAKLLRPTPPEPFDGKDYNQLIKFIQGCRLYFRALRRDLLDPAQAESCVATAATWLKDEPRADFVREMDFIKTWDDFQFFLKGCIKDPLTREFEATRRMQFARQQKGQSARQFLHELEEAEAEVKAAMLSKETMDAYRFLHGLSFELRAAIMGEAPEIRSTRDNILNAALRHENRLEAESRGKKDQSTKSGGQASQSAPAKSKPITGQSQRSHTNRGGKPTPRSASYRNRQEKSEPPSQDKETGSKGSRDVADVVCFECGEKGHYRDQCPDKGKKSKK